MVESYEWLNAITKPDHYPVGLPDIQTFADQIYGAKVFSTIDLARARALIPLVRQDQQKWLSQLLWVCIIIHVSHQSSKRC